MIQEPVDYSMLRMSTNTRQQCYSQRIVPNPQACILFRTAFAFRRAVSCTTSSGFCHHDIIETMKII